jgi:hypothetical protein
VGIAKIISRKISNQRCCLEIQSELKWVHLFIKSLVFNIVWKKSMNMFNQVLEKLKTNRHEGTNNICSNNLNFATYFMLLFVNTYLGA